MCDGNLHNKGYQRNQNRFKRIAENKRTDCKRGVKEREVKFNFKNTADSNENSDNDRVYIAVIKGGKPFFYRKNVGICRHLCIVCFIAPYVLGNTFSKEIPEVWSFSSTLKMRKQSKNSIVRKQRKKVLL